MYKLKKFYKPGFDPQRYWADRHTQQHIAGRSSEEYRRQDFWPLFKDYFKGGEKYLDAGCGTGGWVLFLKDEGYAVEGIDKAPRVIRALMEYDPDLKAKVAEATAIPYPDNFFGGVLAVGTLETEEDKIKPVLEEIYRVLKPGGFFMLEVPIINSLRRNFYIPLKEIERVIKSWGGKVPVFAYYFFDRDELKSLLNDAGFEMVAEQAHELPDDEGHYGLWVDWKFLRGKKPYQLNWLGVVIKGLANKISPWIASTGVVMVARKK